MEDQNPWWKGKEHIEEDEDYRRWSESRVKWIPSLLENIEMKPYCLHFVFGPRQVGKTTLIKLLIRRLLERKVNPKAIFYYRCDKLADFKELDEVVKDYLKVKRMEKINSSYLFLDEVTFPEEWYRTIKWHIDMGNFKNDVLILTGSLSMLVKGEIETFPGRRGYGRDFVMYPLSFNEFLGIINENVYKTIKKFSELSIEEIKEKCFKIMPWIDEVNEAFEIYLKCGGFPLAVKAMLEEGRIPISIWDTYLSWIRGDIVKLRRNESIAKRVIRAIVEKASSTISLLGISKEFEIKSHKTVFNYIDMLEKLFLVKVLYFIDPNRGVEVFYKDRKIHLTDPFLYDIFSSWCLTKKPEDSIIVESIVASHLARKFKVGYWKNRREIDIVAFSRETLGIEVKYKRKAELSKMKIGKIKNIITLTKREFNEYPLAIPVSIFLACLEV